MVIEVGRTEWKSHEREILIEKATVGIGRNLVLVKFPRIHKDGPS